MSVEESLDTLMNRLNTNILSNNQADVVFSKMSSTGGQLWSVTSYNLVWGRGHLYGGATIAVNNSISKAVLTEAFHRYNLYQSSSNPMCSDCVIVVNRVSERVKRTNFVSTSLSPALASAHIWIEIDCGHFLRQIKTWPICANYIKETQIGLDTAAYTEQSSDPNAIYHYPNVPNADTIDWKTKYFGVENAVFLREMGRLWDPDEVFHHSQSIPTRKNDAIGISGSIRLELKQTCHKAYSRKLLLDTASDVVFGVGSILGAVTFQRLVRAMLKTVWLVFVKWNKMNYRAEFDA